jgi:hypothetical protein
LDELAQWAPIIDEAALRGYVGGGPSDSSYYYGAATENPYGYFTVDPYGSYGATEDPYYGYGSTTESPGYVEDHSIYCTSTLEYGGTMSEYEGTTPTPFMLDEVIVTPAPATYYTNADGTYYAVGEDGTIYGYIPEVNVTYVKGANHYKNMAFYSQYQNTFDFLIGIGLTAGATLMRANVLVGLSMRYIFCTAVHK